jgi:hypothetical protein
MYAAWVRAWPRRAGESVRCGAAPDKPVQVGPLLSVLALAPLRIVDGLVHHELDPFSVAIGRLLERMLGDHI